MKIIRDIYTGRMEEMYTIDELLTVQRTKENIKKFISDFKYHRSVAIANKQDLSVFDRIDATGLVLYRECEALTGKKWRDL
jgi:hypothetical protein